MSQNQKINEEDLPECCRKGGSKVEKKMKSTNEIDKSDMKPKGVEKVQDLEDLGINQDRQPTTQDKKISKS